MKTATKKISSLLFILLGFTPLLFVLFITLKKQEIHHRMKDNLEKSKLQTISIPEKDVIWIDDHEIWVNNSMFDIKTKKLENGVFTFTGLYDAEETLLVEQERKEAGKNDDQDKLLSQLFKHLPVFYYQQADHTHINSKQDTNLHWFSFNPVSQFKEIITPPPRVA